MCELNFQIVVVAGKDKRFLSRLLRMKPEYTNLIPLGYVEDVARLMKASDLMIGKGGGLTLSEALASGIPMVIFDPITGQEFFNVDFLVNEGAALYARDSDDLVEKVRFLSERKERLLEMKNNTVRLGKPQSSEVICKTIMEMD